MKTIERSMSTMACFHHVVSGIILLTLFLSVGTVCAAEGDADATFINNGPTVIPDQPLSVTQVNLVIKPNTLNLNSKGVFTVLVTLDGGQSAGKPSFDVVGSSLACSGAEMIRASMSNSDGGTLVAKFHREDLESETSDAGVEITCSGTLLVNGVPVAVEGSDTIRVKGEKKGLESILSRLMKYLGLEKDEIVVDETDDGNITLSVTLNPDIFRNNGQMNKALRTADSDEPEETDYGQNVTTSGQAQDTVTTGSDSDTRGNSGKTIRENNGNGKIVKENNGNGKAIRENDDGDTPEKVNNNANKGDEASNGKSNGKNNK